MNRQNNIMDTNMLITQKVKLHHFDSLRTTGTRMKI